MHILRIAIVTVFTAAVVPPAHAQLADSKTSRHKTKAAASYQVTKPQRAARPASCAEFGAGFVRLPGSDSCIRFGGSVGMGYAVP